MSFDNADFQAALIHEVKNHLGLLGMTLERIPLSGNTEHDEPVDAARLLCQGVADRLQQALWLYKANRGPLTINVDAYSPHDLINALAARTKSLSHGRFVVETRLLLMRSWRLTVLTPGPMSPIRLLSRIPDGYRLSRIERPAVHANQLHRNGGRPADYCHARWQVIAAPDAVANRPGFRRHHDH